MTIHSQSFNFRGGYASQNLAQYLLSLFSFISQPISIADDIGVDFICTTFIIKQFGKANFCVPKNSFAVQIKSESGVSIDLSHQISYLNELELPFFLGIINKTEGSLTLYSGEHLPFLFSHFPLNYRLTVLLKEERNIQDEMNKYNISFDQTNVEIIFPKVMKIKYDFDYFSNQDFTDELLKVCQVISRNIASRKKKEYFFITYSGFLSWLTGPDSLAHFETNFQLQLAESLQNIIHLLKNGETKGEMLKNTFINIAKEYLKLYHQDHLIEERIRELESA